MGVTLENKSTGPSSDMPNDVMQDPDEFAQTMRDIERYHMPFGKYGPDHFPPSGTPVYDLPMEYLQWFSEKGFPNGRIGELLEMVYHIKASGAGEVFDPMRRRAGGRAKLRPERRKKFRFSDSG